MDDINFLKSNADFGVVQGKPLNGWAKFMGYAFIVYGGFSCLGIITAAIGIPLIFAGLKLLKSVEDTKQFAESNSYYNLSNAMDNLNGYFKIFGIVTIVGLALSILLTILYFVIIIFFVAAAGSGGF